MTRRWPLFPLAPLAFVAACGDGGVPRLASSGIDAPAPAAPGAPASDAAAAPPAAPDAGALAAAPLDAAPDAVAPPAPAPGCAGALVCDGFEFDPVGAVPASPWSLSTPDCSGAGALAVDDAQAHEGHRSVRVTGGGGYCDHVFLATTAIAAIDGPVWLRFYVRLGAALGAGHASFLAMHDANDGKDLRMGGQDAILMWNRETNDATLPALSPAGTALSVAPSPGVWHCVEAVVDGASRTLATYVDGAAVAGLAIDATPTPDVDAQWLAGPAWAPRLVDARFGWESYAGEALTLWFDDVAIGPARIGCDTSTSTGTEATR